MQALTTALHAHVRWRWRTCAASGRPCRPAPRRGASGGLPQALPARRLGGLAAGALPRRTCLGTCAAYHPRVRQPSRDQAMPGFATLGGTAWPGLCQVVVGGFEAAVPAACRAVYLCSTLDQTVALICELLQVRRQLHAWPSCVACADSMKSLCSISPAHCICDPSSALGCELQVWNAHCTPDCMTPSCRWPVWPQQCAGPKPVCPQ